MWLLRAEKYFCLIHFVSVKARAPKPAAAVRPSFPGGSSPVVAGSPCSHLAQATAVQKPPSVTMMAFCLLVYEGLLESPNYQTGRELSPTGCCPHSWR